MDMNTDKAAADATREEAIDLLLYCPVCFEQHVDEAKPDVCELCGLIQMYHTRAAAHPKCLDHPFTAWLNPPHKSHRCNFCNHVWRPADIPTNGVQATQTKGERDGSPRPVAFANGKDFNESVASVTHAASKRAVAEFVRRVIEKEHQRREVLIGEDELRELLNETMEELCTQWRSENCS